MTEEESRIVVFVTTETDEEARNIAARLLNRRKVACVNIVPKVNSHFWWKGNLDSAEERLLIIKSKASLLPEIVALVKEIHSYEVPEIIALPIIGGNEDYLRWIDNEVEESTA
ncbi:MAG: divalent-cation tolerance protein CutA [Dehalococcoidia bacterium]